MGRLLVGGLSIVLLMAAAADGDVVRQPSDPCAYSSRAEVASAVGGPVNPGLLETQGPDGGDQAVGCIFTPRASFTVAMPGSNAGFQYARVMFLDEPTFIADTTARPYLLNVMPVDGLGDAAWEASAVHHEVVFVRKGDYRVAFEVAAGLGSFFGPEERLAAIVVPRLPA